jgi:hypothetical protein
LDALPLTFWSTTPFMVFEWLKSPHDQQPGGAPDALGIRSDLVVSYSFPHPRHQKLFTITDMADVLISVVVIYIPSFASIRELFVSYNILPMLTVASAATIPTLSSNNNPRLCLRVELLCTSCLGSRCFLAGCLMHRAARIVQRSLSQKN